MPAGVPEREQGWLRQDELGEMLRTTDNHIYIMIRRAHTLLASHGVVDAAGWSDAPRPVSSGWAWDRSS